MEAEYGLADQEVAQALVTAQYTPEPPLINSYLIADFRGMGAGTIGNLGIVDPMLVGSGASPLDGVVTVMGTWLDLPGVSVRMVHSGGVTAGVILNQTGGSGASSLEVKFEGFRSGTLEVETLGGVAQAQAQAISYHTLTADQLFAPAPIVTLGGGGGSLVYGFTSGSATIPAAGTFGDLINPVPIASSTDPLFVIGSSGGWDLTVRATFPFNPVITGTWSTSYQVWSCDTFEIPQEACANLDAACIAEQLGQVVASSLACALPSNWSSEERTTPPLPLTGQGAGTVTYSANVRVPGTGAPISAPGAPEYLCIVAPLDPGSASQAGNLQAWANSGLRGAMLAPNQQFHEAVAARISNWQAFLPGLVGTGATLRGAYGLPGNNVLLEFHH